MNILKDNNYQSKIKMKSHNPSYGVLMLYPTQYRCERPYIISVMVYMTSYLYKFSDKSYFNVIDDNLERILIGIELYYSIYIVKYNYINIPFQLPLKLKISKYDITNKNGRIYNFIHKLINL